MDELYEYLKIKRDEMCDSRTTETTIDMEHLFRIFQTVCFLRQIRCIVNYEEDMEKMLKRMKSRE